MTTGADSDFRGQLSLFKIRSESIDIVESRSLQKLSSVTKSPGRRSTAVGTRVDLEGEFHTSPTAAQTVAKRFSDVTNIPAESKHCEDES